MDMKRTANKIFQWLGNKNRFSSLFIGPFAIYKRKDGEWCLLIESEDGPFEVQIKKIEQKEQL